MQFIYSSMKSMGKKGFLKEMCSYSFINLLISTLLIVYFGDVEYKNIFCTYNPEDFSGFEWYFKSDCYRCKNRQ